jgi:hypothetical protein
VRSRERDITRVLQGFSRDVTGCYRRVIEVSEECYRGFKREGLWGGPVYGGVGEVQGQQVRDVVMLDGAVPEPVHARHLEEKGK